MTRLLHALSAWLDGDAPDSIHPDRALTDYYAELRATEPARRHPYGGSR